MSTTSQRTIYLSISHNNRTLRCLELAIGTYNIGNDITVDIPLLYPTVSHLHGCLRIEQASCWYEDFESRNGSLLKEQRLKPHQIYMFEEQNPLIIGPFTLLWSQDKKQFEKFLYTTQNFQAETKRKYFEFSKNLLAHPTSHNHNAGSLLRQWAQEQIPQGFEQESQKLLTTVEQIIAQEEGHGPFTEYFDNPQCLEILANNYNNLYVDMGKGLIPLHSTFPSMSHYMSWVQRLVQLAGRRLDLQNPSCEGTLPNGARLQAVLSPLTQSSCSVAIRRFGCAPLSEETALQTQWMTKECLYILRQALVEKKNIVISGGTSTGKTSLLNFLCQYLPPEERVITIEDTFELSLPIKNIVSLQARRANADGIGEVTLRQLIQYALRMRPDRIVVGECRGPEVIEMLQALNTGHPGSLTTVHANSTRDALQRLELLALMGAPNLSDHVIRRWIGTSVHFIVQVERTAAGIRRISEIGKVSFLHSTGEFQIHSLYHAHD